MMFRRRKIGENLRSAIKLPSYINGRSFTPIQNVNVFDHSTRLTSIATNNSERKTSSNNNNIAATLNFNNSHYYSSRADDDNNTNSGQHNLSFFKLDQSNSLKVVNKVIAPAFFKSDENYRYLYPDDDDRRVAVSLRFDKLIPMFTSKQCKTADSYTLYDEDIHQYIGHILLYSPKTTSSFAASSGTDDHEDNNLKFLRQLLATKWSDKMNSFIKICYLSSAMKNEYKHIDAVINKYGDNCGYWEISGVSIDPNIQSKGYGTLMMNYIHNIIKSESKNHNVPTILFTSTPAALKFYKRLGYKVFMQHHINDEITSYSCVYHHDEQVLSQWMHILTKNIAYDNVVNKWSFVPKWLTDLMYPDYTDMDWTAEYFKQLQNIYT